MSVTPGQHDPGSQFVTTFRIYQQSDPLLQSNQATGHGTAKCGEICPSENRASLISKDKLVLSHTATTMQAEELAWSGLANKSLLEACLPLLHPTTTSSLMATWKDDPFSRNQPQILYTERCQHFRQLFFNKLGIQGDSAFCSPCLTTPLKHPQAQGSRVKAAMLGVMEAGDTAVPNQNSLL